MSIHNFTQFPIPAKQISASDVPYGASNVNAELTAQSTSITNLQTAVQMNINQWDEMWEVGGYNNNTGKKEENNLVVRNSIPIKVKPNQVLFFKYPIDGAEVNGYTYDANMNYLGFSVLNANQQYIVPSNCYFINFRTTGAYGTTYNHDISINYPSSFTGYYPSGLPKTNAHIGGLGNVIGMRGWNQLQLTNKPSATVGGVVYTNNGDGSITANGTSTGTTSIVWTTNRIVSIANHKYLVRGCPQGGSSTTYRIILWKNDSSNLGMDLGNGVIYTADSSGFYLDVEPIVTSGVTVSNLVFKPQIFDLTAMGLDYINSVDDFRAMFPAEYYPFYPINGIVKLWTNPTPSVAFDEQTISIPNINSYRGVFFTAGSYMNMTPYVSSTVAYNDGSNFISSMIATNKYTDNYGTRIASVVSGGVLIRNAYQNATTDITTSNSRCVPIAIYGIV